MAATHTRQGGFDVPFLINGPIVPSRDTAANWAAANPVIENGELVRETDTGFIKFGDGITPYNSLPYSALGAVSPTAFEELRQEVIAARGNRSSVDNRIEAISRYSSPCAGELFTGDVVDNSRVSTAPTTITGVANAIRLLPFITSRPFTASSIGGRVTTAAAGFVRFLVYGSDANGWPGPKLFEGAEDLSAASAAPVFHSGIELNIQADRVYWLGIRYGTPVPVMAALQSYSAPNLGLIGGMSGTTYASMIQRVLTLSIPAPDDWAYVSSERLAGNPVAIRLQVA
jgi:hypothetical protein